MEIRAGGHRVNGLGVETAASHGTVALPVAFATLNTTTMWPAGIVCVRPVPLGCSNAPSRASKRRRSRPVSRPPCDAERGARHVVRGPLVAVLARRARHRSERPARARGGAAHRVARGYRLLRWHAARGARFRVATAPRARAGPAWLRAPDAHDRRPRCGECPRRRGGVRRAAAVNPRAAPVRDRRGRNSDQPHDDRAALGSRAGPADSVQLGHDRDAEGRPSRWRMRHRDQRHRDAARRVRDPAASPRCSAVGCRCRTTWGS